MPNRPRGEVFALGLLAVALAARGALAAGRPLWHDELFTIWAARLSPRALVDALSRDSGPPVFYLLEKPFVRLAEAFAASDRIARLLPFAAALLVALGARALASARSRALFLVLLATSPFLLVYSAEARAYAPLALAGLALYLLATRGDPTPRRLAGVFAVALLMLWLHYLAIFFVASLALLLALRRRWPALAALGAAAVAFAPWIPVLRSQPAAATAWMREDPATSAAGILSALGGAGRIPGPVGSPLPDALFAAGIAAGAAALLAALLSTEREAADASRVTLIFLAAVLAVSFFRPVAIAGRTEMAILPLWLWSVSAAAERGRFARIVAVLLAGLAAASSAILLSSAAWSASDASPLLDAARKAVRREDVLVATAGFYLRARIASDRGAIPGELWSFPLDLERHPGWFRAEPPTKEELDAFSSRLAAQPRGRRFLFLLHPVYGDLLVDRLLVRRGPVETLRSDPGGLLLSWTPTR